MIIKPEKPEELVEFLKSKPFILYGMGDTGTRIAKWCEEHGISCLFSDKNASKSIVYGERYIVPCDIMQKCADANIIVTSLVYGKEIIEDLLQLGVKKEQIFSCAIFMPDKVTWKELEEGSRADWELMKRRIEALAGWGWIPEKIKTVADYGCGHRFIEKLLPLNTVYYPIDYISRGDDTIVCDFNKQMFPDVYSELSICFAVLMCIGPANELVAHICRHTERRILLSFVTLEGFPDIDARRSSAMIQDFTSREITDMFAEHGFELKDRKEDMSGNTVMTFFLFDKIQ